MEIIKCVQGSEEWFDAKRGIVSASHFKEVLNKKTGRSLYMRKVAAEILTGQTEETYTNKIIENGTDTEAEARECYEHIYHEKVVQVGFVKMNEWVGCSPDGLIGKDGTGEIKSPLASTHIDYIMKDAMPPVYIPQVQGQLWVTGRAWCDFISYNPYFKNRPLWSKRIQRDEDYITELAWQVSEFVQELKELIAKIEKGVF